MFIVKEFPSSIEQLPRTARGIAVPATEQEIAKEDSFWPLASDEGLELVADFGAVILRNMGEMGYTHPNLHRRIDQNPEIPQGSNYPFVKYREDGTAYPQHVVIGVWDGRNSYRTTTTYTHDEESETCEIP